MEIKFVNDHDNIAWDSFVIQNAKDSGFLQSYKWGEFQKATGKKVHRLTIFDQDERIACCQIIVHSLSFGKSYLYCPRGPVFSDINNKEALGLLIKEIKEIATKENAIFLLFEPANEISLIDLGFQKSNKSIQPPETLILDIEKTEEEILSNMKPKTRYNIKLAQKKGVKIERDDSEDAVDKFVQMLQTTADRTSIGIHSYDYFKTMIKVLGKENIRIYNAKYNNEIIASNIIVNFGKYSIYLHGGTDLKYKEVMAPHFLQWTQIQDAKIQNKKYYDFWGIATQGNKIEKWKGITRFKTGFSKDFKSVFYPGVFTYVYKPFWFKLYNAIKKLV